MTVQRFSYVDISVQSAESCGNPFYVDLIGTFTSEKGTILRIPGFYDGENIWKVRFSPTEPGAWEYTIFCNQLPELNSSGTVLCVENTNPNIHGALQVHEGNNRYFQFEDGTPYFMMAYEVDWLFVLFMKGEDEAKAFIDKIVDYRFNSIIMNVYAHECTWTDPNTPGRLAPPPLYPWEGSNENPDHSRLNIEFFRRYDLMMDYLLEKGIIAHIYFFVYNKEVKWPDNYSLEEDMFIKQVVARYQAYSNVVWDLAKEAYYLPDTQYVYEKLCYIKSYDGYNRLLTVHDNKTIYRDANISGILDFITIQQHQDFHSQAVMEYELGRKPVVNAEFGYECGPGGLEDKTFFMSLLLEDYMQRAYDVAMAGAGLCYYYTFTGWDVIRPDDTPPGYACWKRLYELFTSLRWWNYIPRPDLCLWTPSACYANEGAGEYLLKTNHYGELLFGLDMARHDFEGTWFDIMTGDIQALKQEHMRPSEDNAVLTIFTGPFGKNCVLKLTAIPH